MQTTIGITGMTCGHCVASIIEELSELDGVEQVDVQLNKDGVSTASITSETAPDPAAVRQAVTEAGYTLVDN